MYYFSSLALSLNEAEEGIAPTDSRHRPDQRLMEDGRSGRRGRTEGREARSRPVWQTPRGAPRLPFPRKDAQRVLWGSDPWGVSADRRWVVLRDRKSTRLNSSH